MLVIYMHQTSIETFKKFVYVYIANLLPNNKKKHQESFVKILLTNLCLENIKDRI